MSQQGAPSQQNGQPGNTRPKEPPMYRPEQMRNITILTPEERQTFERGLNQLWTQFNNSAEGSNEKNMAKKKIIDFGPILVKKVQERKLQQQKQQQANQQQVNQQQGQQQGGQAPSQDAGAQPQPPTTTTSNSQPGQAAPANAQKGPGMIQMPPTPAAQQMAAGAAQSPQQMAQPQSQQSQHLQSGLSPAIRAHLAQMTWNPPPHIASRGHETVTKWQSDAKKKYAQSLMNMESSRAHLAKLDGMVKQRTESNQPLSAEETKVITERKTTFQKMYEDSQRFVDIFRKTQLQQPNRPAGQGAQGAQGAATGATQAQSMKQSPSNQGMAAGMQGQQADINGAFEAAKKESIAAGSRMPGAGLPSGLQQQQAQATSGGQGGASSPGGQAPVKIEPGAQQRPHPPPINTQIPAGATSGPNTAQLNSAATLQHQLQQQQQQQQQQRIQTPQVATHPQVPGAAGVALSHQKALEQANIRARANSQTGSISGQGGAIAVTSAGTPQSGGGANSAGVIGTAAQQPQPPPQQAGSHPHSHPTNQALQAKLPIPKQLPERATQLPVPVSLGGGMAGPRPTLTGGSGIAGGVMNQPVIAKLPAVTMESDSEHVLNKKKLDELVRQVCGGTAEGQEGNLLSPDVEESVLNLADDFVDRVLHTACRNAKERGSKTLEIRDIQLVLERSYNMRIPGYSSDELRTFRKPQPNPAWISKLSAVQAAKVTQGKGDV